MILQICGCCISGMLKPATNTVKVLGVQLTKWYYRFVVVLF